MERYRQLTDIWRAAIRAADPFRATIDAFRRENGRLVVAGADYDLSTIQRVVVIGAGKATARMAEAVETILGDHISGGLIIVKHGYSGMLRSIAQVEASHPIPDRDGVVGTQKILQIAHKADARTLTLCLLSGGGSALLVAPSDGITLEDKQCMTGLLMKAGATISELNTVRKHLSAVKGGLLARAVSPAALVTLILSDVIGDRLDVIASGPTVPDSTCFADASRIIDNYGLRQTAPRPVVARIDRGVAGAVSETAKAKEAGFLKNRTMIVGSIAQALVAAWEAAASLGLKPEIITRELQGEASKVAADLARSARAERAGLRPGEVRCLLFGGETTVTVRGKGRGGRNQELALAFAREIAGEKGITLLSAGTDGTDGPTDAAGAIVDGKMALQAAKNGISLDEYLADNDSYSFFERFDAATGKKTHFKPGPTGTNVMDIHAIILDG
jgi:glycerate 2-kinase